MSKVTVKGEEYELLLDLNAMEYLEDLFDGDSAKAVAALRGKGFRNTRKLFVAMANSGFDHQKKDKHIGLADLDHLGVGEIARMTDAIAEAEIEGYRADTVNGAADDEKHDDVLEEIEAEDEKNGEAGGG